MLGNIRAQPYQIICAQTDHRREQRVAGRGRRKKSGLKIQDLIVGREQSGVVSHMMDMEHDPESSELLR